MMPIGDRDINRTPTFNHNLSASYSLMQEDNQNEIANFGIICIEVIAVFFLIYFVINKFPKWSAAASNPIKRFGLVSIMIGFFILISSLVYWHFVTERPLVFVSKDWHKIDNPKFPFNEYPSKERVWITDESSETEVLVRDEELGIARVKIKCIADQKDEWLTQQKQWDRYSLPQARQKPEYQINLGSLDAYCISDFIPKKIYVPVDELEQSLYKTWGTINYSYKGSFFINKNPLLASLTLLFLFTGIISYFGGTNFILTQFAKLRKWLLTGIYH
jgi:hypothetical protein